MRTYKNMRRRQKGRTLPVIFSQTVDIVEVGPRDGLQSQSRVYHTDRQIAMIEILAEAGLRTIEVTGMVRSAVVPQLGDADELLSRLTRRRGVRYRALCPNRRGVERAIAGGVDVISGLITASETYNAKNVNMTVRENLCEAAQMARMSHAARIPIIMGIGVCTFCPYEGELSHARLMEIIGELYLLGIESFTIATSAGLDGPRRVYEVCVAIKEAWPDVELGLHLHNTNGMAFANVLAGLQAGVTCFEGAISGIGGGIQMPKRSANYGNLATEALVHMLSEMSIETGIDLSAVSDASERVRDRLGLRNTHGYVLSGATKDAVRSLGRRSSAAEPDSGAPVVEARAQGASRFGYLVSGFHDTA